MEETITDENISAFAEEAMNCFIGAHHHPDYKTGIITGAKWVKKQLNPEWISVTDRFPNTSANDDLIKVLGWDGVQVLRVDYYKYQDETSGRFRISCLKCFNEVTDVITHWMELPNPPKQD